ncbi:sucrose-specific PTS transporter subunit IIBC [Latilactobacillus curvatus]|uniref:sucrose-specific PTS transporter subunit IIBC n=1 Tax=Latilactobacillus curvatus TaxID=28038 RepID=UPI00280BF5BA|nr:sucrose-specific PTS transporter subunit IIBC [Latilactobacillus curvatus]
MDNKELAKQILLHIGGKENVKSAMHCATRLRIITKDQSKVDVDAIEDLPKVKGSFYNAGQYQVILGTGLVDKVYDEFATLIGGGDGYVEADDDAPKEKMTFQRAIRIFGDVFVPIIPVLVATGLFMGLRGLLTQDALLHMVGLSSKTIPANFITFTQVLTDTAFAFLPALVAWSTFKNFGGSPVLGIALGLMLVSSSLPNAYDVGSGKAQALMFFGFIKVTGYQGSVLPAFITGIVGSQIEKWLKKHIPDSFDLILTPFLTLLSGLLLALFIIGPIFHSVENAVLVAVQWLLNLPFGIGGLIYGSFGQLLGIFGIHHILNFLEITMLSQTGWDYLNPIGTCGNMAQAGAVLAVGLRVASKKIKQVAYPSALSASLGITEPAVFGVNLRLIKPYVCAMIGGGVGGFFASILHLKATGMALTGIPGTLLYLNNQLPLYILVNLIAFGVAFVLTWMFAVKKDTSFESASTAKTAAAAANNASEPAAEAASVKETASVKSENVAAPISGQLEDLSETNDPVFSQKLMGDGAAIIPTDNTIYAPVSGEVTVAFETKHAYGIQSDNGAEILIHVGINTVELKGKNMESFVSPGQRVNAGDKMGTVDVQAVKDAGYDPTVMLIVTNSASYSSLNRKANQQVEHGDDVLTLNA